LVASSRTKRCSAGIPKPLKPFQGALGDFSLLQYPEPKKITCIIIGDEDVFDSQNLVLILALLIMEDISKDH
jgi:hypothetical protein